MIERWVISILTESIESPDTVPKSTSLLTEGALVEAMIRKAIHGVRRSSNHCRH